MRQGLSIAEDGILLIKTKTKQQRKLPRGGKTQLAIWHAGQEKAGQDQDTNREHMTTNWQDYKHKENKQGANEEGNEGQQVGQLNK